jgi:hypothetical protein
VWSKAWPVIAGQDVFNGVAASSAGVYVAGFSYPRTSDTVGGKEVKGLVVKFGLADPNGGAGYAGADWDQQTPLPPGAFSYGGGESLAAVSVNVESSQVYAYATGAGQQNGVNGGRMFLSKLDSAGTIQWTQTDAAEMVSNRYTVGHAVAASGGSIYVAGRDDDDATSRPSLRKYDTASGIAGRARPMAAGAAPRATATATALRYPGATVPGQTHRPGDAASDFDREMERCGRVPVVAHLRPRFRRGPCCAA